MAIVKTAGVIRGAERAARGFDSDKRGEIGGGSTSENSETECANLILNSIFYSEPVEVSQQGSDMITWGSSENEAGSIFHDFLNFVKQGLRQTREQGV